MPSSKTTWLLLDVYPLYHFVDNEGPLLSIDELKQLVSLEVSGIAGVIERRPGHAGNLGNGALGYPEAQE